MKRNILFLATTALLAVSATASFAAPLGGHPFAADRVDARLARMTDRLDLSTEQQAQIRTILDEAHARRDQERQQTRAAIDAVLTDAQRAAQDRRLADRMDRRLGRLTDRLDLSPEQQEQLQALLHERRDDPALTRTEVRERMAGILDDDQLARLDDLRGGRGGRDGGCDRSRSGDRRGW